METGDGKREARAWPRIYLKSKIREDTGGGKGACTVVSSGGREGKRKPRAVPVGRVCSSVRYGSRCQHTRCAQYSHCHTARHTFLSPLQPDTCTFLNGPSCRAHVPSMRTGYILPPPSPLSRPPPKSPPGPPSINVTSPERNELISPSPFALSALTLCIYYRLDTLPDIGLI